MALEATQYSNKDDSPWELSFSLTGIRGKRVYTVPTDTEKAFRARLLPQLGDSWSSEYPNLRVVSIGPNKLEGGFDVDGDGGGGVMRIPVEYETPSVGGRFVPSTENDVWTEMRTQIESVRVYYPVERIEGGGAPFAPIQGGDGVDVPAMSMSMSVHTYLPDSKPFPTRMILELGYPKCKLNDDRVTVPNLNHTGRTEVFDAGQLMYQGIETTEKIDRWLHVVHSVRAAANFDYLWSSQATEGNEAVRYRDRLLERMSFRGLWPGS